MPFKAEDAEAKIPKREACEEAEAPETEEAEEVELEPEPEASIYSSALHCRRRPSLCKC